MPVWRVGVNFYSPILNSTCVWRVGEWLSPPLLFVIILGCVCIRFMVLSLGKIYVNIFLIYNLVRNLLWIILYQAFVLCDRWWWIKSTVVQIWQFLVCWPACLTHFNVKRALLLTGKLGYQALPWAVVVISAVESMAKYNRWVEWNVGQEALWKTYMYIVSFQYRESMKFFYLKTFLNSVMDSPQNKKRRKPGLNFTKSFWLKNTNSGLSIEMFPLLIRKEIIYAILQSNNKPHNFTTHNM
jgi:hypothetical protein